MSGIVRLLRHELVERSEHSGQGKREAAVARLDTRGREEVPGDSTDQNRSSGDADSDPGVGKRYTAARLTERRILRTRRAFVRRHAAARGNTAHTDADEDASSNGSGSSDAGDDERPSRFP